MVKVPVILMAGEGMKMSKSSWLLRNKTFQDEHLTTTVPHTDPLVAQFTTNALMIIC